MNANAIILGRAGSKGVPGKNLADVAGRPCAAWTIEAAQRSTRMNRVIVSSDSPELLVLARSMGAETVERPPELASDLATIDAAARHAVEVANIPDAPIAILYANVPVRPESLIDDAIDLLISTGCDSVQSYAPVGKHHPWWMTRVDPDSGEVRPWQGDVLNHGVYRRQDLPPAHLPDGGIITLSRAALRLERGAPEGPHAFFGLNRRGIITQEGAVIDIDTDADLARAAKALDRTAHTKRAG